MVMVPGAWTGYCSLNFYTESFTILMGECNNVCAYTSLNLYFLGVCCNMAIANESVYAVLRSSVVVGMEGQRRGAILCRTIVFA